MWVAIGFYILGAACLLYLNRIHITEGHSKVLHFLLAFFWPFLVLAVAFCLPLKKVFYFFGYARQTFDIKGIEGFQGLIVPRVDLEELSAELKSVKSETKQS